MFARRAGIDNAGACRVPTLVPEAFFEAAMARWSDEFGSHRRW
jgi:hypothetical protein